MTPTTLFDKIWSAHEIAPGLIYIDLHLVHEVTSPQAFEGLRLAGREVRRPDRTLATADHNVPTDGTPVSAKIHDALSPPSGRGAGGQLRRVRHPALLARLRPPGHRPHHRAGAGRHPAGHDDRLRRLAHGHARRVRRAGVRDRDLRGRARARHPDARPAEAEVDADQLRRRARPRRHRQGPDPGHDRPDGHQRRRRPRRRVRRRGHRGDVDGRADDDLQHDDRGRRPRGHDRARPDHLRLGRKAARARRRTSRRRWRTGARSQTDEGATFDREITVDASAVSPVVTWGTNPGQVVPVSEAVPQPQLRDRRALAGLHGPGGRHADAASSSSTASSSARAPTPASATCAPPRR